MGLVDRLLGRGPRHVSSAEKRADRATMAADAELSKLRSVADRMEALVGRLEEQAERWSPPG